METGQVKRRVKLRLKCTLEEHGVRQRGVGSGECVVQGLESGGKGSADLSGDCCKSCHVWSVQSTQIKSCVHSGLFVFAEGSSAPARMGFTFTSCSEKHLVSSGCFREGCRNQDQAS